ncbi:glutamine--fructose-6-phosphate transaminase (isomerizing) [Sulfuracidifex tepidarius]|uniref:Glutamine--fructose-6-phosphate aminotransferase [isomerizing] n=1 Tax=Sulfuracidifex tepidarius TaxID=1294262 RepID=A0A510E350_9CREN|nr:glutamine--fructose-6-phosphate transaminase (isomerizing) [Sulfuracidifex tepidarius]BBG26934.1 Glutamine--fructose-6-phosphate aminotransferase [Sulfuracidifex tepidarius]
MCGIIGIASNKKDKSLTDVLVSSLSRLEYRGYDSVGVASLDDEGIDVRKAKGKVVEVVKTKKINEMSGYIFLGHTRWATHGAPNDQNAHPHVDCSGRIAVVHNGTLNNYKELREELESLGHKFRSDTDTEVIPHLVEEFMKRDMESFEAFKAAVSSLRGSYAILMIMEGEKRIFFARLDNPLVIGLGEDKNFIASEYAPFLPLTNTVVTIQDGEIGFITPSSVYIEKDGKIVDVNERVHKLNFTLASASKGGYSHFMLKEIHDSPLAVKETLSTMMADDSVDKAVKVMSQANRIFVVAAGTSYHAGLIFGRELNMSGFTVIPMIASEYPSYRTRAGDVILALSQSGETLDVKMAIKEFKNEGSTIISITNVIESTISRESDVKLYMRAGPELGVAATKTFVSQVASLLLLKSKILGEKLDYLSHAHEVLEASLEGTEGQMKKWSSTLISAPSMYYLSKGVGLPMALEGALKIKEVAYVHAEAYPAGESKHGPIALVSEGFPVVFLDPGIDELKVNIEEMKSRGARIFYVGTSKGISKDEVEVRLEKGLEPFALAPPIQLLAYYVSVGKGLDPDRPRNLAKTVTVE